MNTSIKHLFIFSSLIFLTAGYGNCQGGESNLLLSNISSSFSKIGSIQYVVNVAVEDHLKSGEFLAPALTPEKRIKIEYSGAQDRYYYKVSTQWWKSKPLAEHEVAFNGMHYQWLRKGGQQIAIGTTEPGLDWEFAENNILTMPFQFLLINKNGEIGNACLSDLGKSKLPSVTEKDLDKAQSENSSTNFSIYPGGRFADVHPTLVYKVYYGNRKEPFPTRWQLLTERGKVAREYIVDEVGETNGFKYAKKSRLIEYGIHLEEPSQAPRATLHFEVSTLILDSLQFDAAIFTIDPAKANMIWDSDNKIGISVPK